MRFKRESELLWETYPEQYLDLAEVLTQFGGAEGIVLVLAVLFWLTDREKVLVVAAFAVAGISVLLIAKAAFSLPRPVPDPAMQVEMVYDHGDDEYGFPSGHAFMSVVVYGGLLSVFGKVRDHRWVLAVATLILSISLTRIFLRVHYLGDLVVGALLAVAFLVVMKEVVTGTPHVGFAIGIVLGVPAILLSGAPLSLVATEEFALVGFSASLGGFVASLFLDSIPELRTRIEGVILTVSGFIYIVGTMSLYAGAVGDPGTLVTNLLIVVFYAALIAGIFLLPVVVSRLETQRQRVMNRRQTA